MDKKQEVIRLKSIRADFDRARDAIKAFEDVSIIDDILEQLDDALRHGIDDIDGYIKARENKWKIYYIATPNHVTTTGSVQYGLDTFTDYDKAVKDMESERKYWANTPGEELWFVGLQKVEDNG